MLAGTFVLCEVAAGTIIEGCFADPVRFGNGRNVGDSGFLKIMDDLQIAGKRLIKTALLLEFEVKFPRPFVQQKITSSIVIDAGFRRRVVGVPGVAFVVAEIVAFGKTDGVAFAVIFF